MQQQFLYLSSAEAQLSLGLGEEKTTERLFFAVMADAITATHAAQIGSALLQAGLVEGKPLAPERLHVTLHHLGDYAGGLPPSLVRVPARRPNAWRSNRSRWSSTAWAHSVGAARNCRACCVAKSRYAGCTTCKARWAGNWRTWALPAMRNTPRT